jgi:hypothetical protein
MSKEINFLAELEEECRIQNSAILTLVALKRLPLGDDSLAAGAIALGVSLKIKIHNPTPLQQISGK